MSLSLFHPNMGITGVPYYTWLYVGPRGPNTGMQACMANTLHTDPSPQPKMAVFLVWLGEKGPQQVEF